MKQQEKNSVQLQNDATKLLAEREKSSQLKEQALETQNQSLHKKKIDLDAQYNELKQNQTNLKQEKSLFEQEKKQLSIELKKAKDLQAHIENEKIALSNERLEVENGLPHQLAEYRKQLDQQAKHKEQQTDGLKIDLDKSRVQLTNEQQLFFTEKEQLLQRVQSFELECQAEKQLQFDQIQQEISAKRDALNAELIAAKESAHQHLDDELKHKRAQLARQQQELVVDTEAVKKQQTENQLVTADVKANKQALENHISERIKDYKLSLEKSLKQKEDEIERLRSGLTNAQESLGLYQELEQQLGAEPARVLAQLSATKEELNRLSEELLARPTQEIQEFYDRAKAQLDETQQRAEYLADENKQLQSEVYEIEQVLYQLQRTKIELGTSEAINSARLDENNKLIAEIERLNVGYKSEVGRDDRLEQIRSGVIARPQGDAALTVWPKGTSEVTWLNTIKDNVSDFGLKFDDRILYSFHTALKISEWSPLTVLAGVSGTGKSELPKLYSHFGGLNFMSVPVQPNWDSQESMLGYFNAIDNVFDAQPILKFLVQSQTEKTVNPDGLKDMMNLVLLDEMNLAHVEMYFADFLSKLEERRSAHKNNLPSIDIKLGAKLEPYKLSLGRNMLFAGTMNQDETTKALSDKVLDRGVSIYFPRPTTLITREKLKTLNAPSHFLSMQQWVSWVKFESNLPKLEQNKYKDIVEDINNHLGEIGKALGHRVWQSIEYFMVNHPLVLAFSENGFDDANYKKALHFAFEDQLVQKVMPKLRGIETRGISKDRCLSPIRALLEDEKFNIVADFERAMIMGHGQFMWCSADYLNDEASQKEYQVLVRAASGDFKNKSNIKQQNSQKSKSPTPEQFQELSVYARNMDVEIFNLSAQQIIDCLDISGFAAKDFATYLSENAPKGTT